jgi:hypothetical protein
MNLTSPVGPPRTASKEASNASATELLSGTLLTLPGERLPTLDVPESELLSNSPPPFYQKLKAIRQLGGFSLPIQPPMLTCSGVTSFNHSPLSILDLFWSVNVEPRHSWYPWSTGKRFMSVSDRWFIFLTAYNYHFLTLINKKELNTILWLNQPCLLLTKTGLCLLTQ